MSFRLPLNDHNLPKIAASAILPNRPVKDDTTADQVLPCATKTDRPRGMTQASAGAADPVAVYTSGVVNAVAGASLGAGAEVGVASTNGALGPVAAASGLEIFAVGTSQDAAVAGEVFAVDLTFRSIQTGGG